ncbi:MAG: hypothetical protein MK082_05870 [Phycisphaerales bacterium]|nr:hypothetical protein [Phycisphaerales bacterium]
MKNVLFAASAAMILAGSATADFTGFQGDVSTYDDGATTWEVIDMYAEFDGAQAVLNVFNADIVGDFNHNDLADAQGGSWKPSFSFEVPTVYDPMRDSYVTIGYGVGAMAALNQTALDPNFGTGLGSSIPTGAGWFNLAPDNPQYATDDGTGTYRLHIGQFVSTDMSNFSFTADIGFNDGPGTEVSFGNGSWVPAPGALALLGLSGIVARRRRA